MREIRRRLLLLDPSIAGLLSRLYSYCQASEMVECIIVTNSFYYSCATSIRVPSEQQHERKVRNGWFHEWAAVYKMSPVRAVSTCTYKCDEGLAQGMRRS